MHREKKKIDTKEVFKCDKSEDDIIVPEKTRISELESQLKDT